MPSIVADRQCRIERDLRAAAETIDFAMNVDSDERVLFPVEITRELQGDRIGREAKCEQTVGMIARRKLVGAGFAAGSLADVAAEKVPRERLLRILHPRIGSRGR